uniref:Uncharacterized protein n=1 Tax=Ditylenchus dipsaci TaxID=166011 RepID=A0A915DN79_9BILA
MSIVCHSWRRGVQFSYIIVITSVVLLDHHQQNLIQEQKEVEAIWDWHEIPSKQAQLIFAEVNSSAELLNKVCDPDSLTIIIGSTGLDSNRILLPVSNPTNLIPMFVLPGLDQPFPRLKQFTKDGSIDVLPSPMAVGSTLLALVQEREFSEVVLLYEHSQELVTLQNFLRDSHQPGRLKTLVRALSHSRDHGPLLKDLLHRYPSAFNSTKISSPSLLVVIHADLQTSQELLSQARFLECVAAPVEDLSTSRAGPKSPCTTDSLASLNLNKDLDIKQCNVTTFSAIDPTDPQLPGIRLHLRQSGAKIARSMVITRVAVLSDMFLLIKRALELNDEKRILDGTEYETGNCEKVDPRLAAFRQLVVDASTLIDEYEEYGLTGPLQISTTGSRIFHQLFVLTKNLSGIWKVCDMEQHFPSQLALQKRPVVEEVLTDDLDGKVLKVTVILEEPFVMLKAQANHLNLTGNEQYEGYCIDLLEMIARMKNFTYLIHEVKDKSYGVKEAPPNRWNGMVGELQTKVSNNEMKSSKGKADIWNRTHQQLTSNLKQRNIKKCPARIQTYEILVRRQLWSFKGISILFKRPETTQPGIFNFTSPMAWDVWLAMLFAYIFASTFLWLMAKLSPNENFVFFNITPVLSGPTASLQAPNTRERSRSSITTLFLLKQRRRQSQAIPKTHKFTLLNSFWFTVSSLMQQGSDLSPRSASTRLAAAVWWFFALIFISSYTANLAAFLTAERMITPIENADDLARQTKIKYGTLNRGSTMTFFKDSKVETYEKMWKLMESQASLFVTSSKEGIERVKNGDYAYLMESSMLEYALERDCELIQIGGLLDQKGYAFGLAKGSPYRKPISTTILRLQEKTVLTELKDKWWKKERGGGACSYKKLSQSEFGARSVGGIFLILTIGILISVFIALGELIAHVKGKKAINNADLHHMLMQEIKKSIKEKQDDEATTAERENHLTKTLDELIELRHREVKLI